ncbi:hypothetical protein HZH68_015097 [Vespula germanica]|uniref:Uncharacterized protein n=1 Tax=Vespula germanica TaxID=30212 RepID=A0A834J7B9_VESGE|nr:hypothetical protein HZH68_015097 [Vespula germanica]
MELKMKLKLKLKLNSETGTETRSGSGSDAGGGSGRRSSRTCTGEIIKVWISTKGEMEEGVLEEKGGWVEKGGCLKYSPI